MPMDTKKSGWTVTPGPANQCLPVLAWIGHGRTPIVMIITHQESPQSMWCDVTRMQTIRLIEQGMHRSLPFQAPRQ